MTHKDRKAEIRAQTLRLRDNIPAEVRSGYSLAMAQSCNHITFTPGTVVSGFLPIRSEADLRPLMERLAAAGARLCLPVILDRLTIVFREFRPDVPLVYTGFGTQGPGPEAPVLDPEILLVPLSAFDATGHRIGYGAGHYDRAIARLRQKGRVPRLIGIAFDCQEVAHVPFEPHDVPLDAILTESGFRQFVV